MRSRLRLLVLGVAVSVAALLAASPPAMAETWAPCPAHAFDDQTVRVFPRNALTRGPAGTSSELRCGNHFYGLRRIETEWTGIPDWRARADAAIGRALTSDRAPVHDRRTDTWTYRAPGAIVVIAARGLIVDALPAAT